MTRLRLNRFAVLSALLLAQRSWAGTVLYVDDSAPGANDGSSWCDAFADLQDALDVVELEPDTPFEIRVAGGTYRPSKLSEKSDPRSATFNLPATTILRGGYAGCAAPDPNERFVSGHESVLSGDIAANDGPAFAGIGENSYHVVTASRTGESAVLDGFTIVGGNADQPSFPHGDGAGLFSDGGELTVMNCVFTRNAATLAGGGMYVGLTPEIFPRVVNCRFNGNRASIGGGLFSNAVPVSLINCTIYANLAGARGGGLAFAVNTAATVQNCILWANEEGQAGANSAQVFDSGGLATAHHCCVQNAAGNLTGQCIVDEDPLFIDAPGADGIPGTLDDDLSLSAGSPCVDSGDNDIGAAAGVLDLSGLPRRVDDPQAVDCLACGDPPSCGAGAPIDMGAYERQAGCSSDQDCSDGVLCNGGEVCQAGLCRPGEPPDCADGVACTDDVCDQVLDACVHTADDARCDNGAFCDGMEFCDALLDCQAGTSVTCDDEVPCTDDTCDELTDSCTSTPNDGHCDNGLFCDGTESCDPALGCRPGTAPCPDTSFCDETLDRCGSCLTNGDCDDGDPCNGMEICDGTLQCTESLDADCNANGIEDECDLAETSDDCNLNSVPDECDIASEWSPDEDGNDVPDECQSEAGVLFVDDDVPAIERDGSTWVRAYRDLQEALDHAESSAGAVQQIRVAAGTYFPSKRTNPADPLSVSFRLVNGVGIYGGYAGVVAAALAPQDSAGTGAHARNLSFFPTVLSGNLGDPNDKTDNPYHVVIASGTDSSTVLDGLVIQGGYALARTYPHFDERERGAGIYNIGGSPTLRDCTIRHNEAPGPWTRGGGMYNGDFANPLLIRCTFYQNRAYVVGPTVSGPGGGGAMCNVNQSHPTILDSVFLENVSDKGAAIYNVGGSNPNVERCTFEGNISRGGGGMFLEQSSPRIHRCRFLANVGTGGGLLIGGNSYPMITNSWFLGNYGDGIYSEGGAVYVGDLGAPLFRNCLFAGNGLTRSQYEFFSGGAIHCDSRTSGNLAERPIFENCTIAANYILNPVPGHCAGISCEGSGATAQPIIRSCIIWGNFAYGAPDEADQIKPGDVLPSIEYSLIQGWTGALGGVGNFGGEPVAHDPRFLDPPGADGMAGTPDDNFRVAVDSPCIDAGYRTEPPAPDERDLDGRLRVHCRAVDIGAYEHGTGDHDGNEVVDLQDSVPWPACLTGPQGGDMQATCQVFESDGDGDIDLQDYAAFMIRSCF